MSVKLSTRLVVVDRHYYNTAVGKLFMRRTINNFTGCHVCLWAIPLNELYFEQHNITGDGRIFCHTFCKKCKDKGRGHERGIWLEPFICQIKSKIEI